MYGEMPSRSRVLLTVLELFVCFYSLCTLNRLVLYLAGVKCHKAVALQKEVYFLSCQSLCLSPVELVHLLDKMPSIAMEYVLGAVSYMAPGPTFAMDLKTPI